MHHIVAAATLLALSGFAVPDARAAETSLDRLVQSLPDEDTVYVKKGGWQSGKGWKHGRAWGHHRVRGGPPPWAPAHGYRRKHRW